MRSPEASPPSRAQLSLGGIINTEGVPVIGITLIFGIVRMQLAILAFHVVFGTMDSDAILSTVQLRVHALVSMLSIPCIFAILVLASESDWRRALAISDAEIVLVITIGGIVAGAGTWVPGAVVSRMLRGTGPSPASACMSSFRNRVKKFGGSMIIVDTIIPDDIQRIFLPRFHPI